jgi:protein-disulfide isomerase
MKLHLHGRNAVYLGVGVAALAIALALILVSVLGSSSGTSASKTSAAPSTSGPASSAPAIEPKVPGAAATAALFRGIPQHLNQLGNPNAKVTMVEFADPQCPYCQRFALDVLPTIVKEYVRTGKVKLVLFAINVIGPDSDNGLRGIYAAGLQGKAWNFADLLFKSQGAENSGWINDDLLRRTGNSIPGLDTGKMLADRFSPEVDSAITASSQQASNARVGGTPTFFAGRTGGTLQQMAITSLTPDGFRPTLDSLVK